MILFVPETAFRRSHRYDTDLAASSTSQILSKPNSPSQPNADPDFPVDLVQVAAYREKGATIEEQDQTVPAKRDGWVKRLALFNGRKTDDALWKLVLRPIVLVVHPAVFWGMLTQGALIGWSVMIGVVLAFIVSLPPFSPPREALFTPHHSTLGKAADMPTVHGLPNPLL